MDFIEKEIFELESKKDNLINKKQNLSYMILKTEKHIEQLDSSLWHLQQSKSTYILDQDQKLSSLNQKKDSLINSNDKKSKLIRKAFSFIIKLFLILLFIATVFKFLFKFDFISSLVDIFILLMIILFCFFIIKIGYSIIVKNRIKHLDIQISIIQNMDLSINNTEVQKLENDKSDAEILLKKYQEELNDINNQLSKVDLNITSFSNFRDSINNFNSKYYPIDNDSILSYICINNNNNDYASEHLSVKKLYLQLSQYSNSYSCKSILSENELLFYNKLLSITNRDYTLIQFKIRLSDIIQLGSFANKEYKKQWKEERTREYLNAINNKHVDFVLFDKNTLQIKLCIELDDASHYDYNSKHFKREHINNHIAKDIIFSYCKIPFFRFDSSQITAIDNETLLKHMYAAINQHSVYYDYTETHKKLFEESLYKLSHE